MVELAVAEGTIVTWRTEETIPVGFGTIHVVPVWRFLLEMPQNRGRKACGSVQPRKLSPVVNIWRRFVRIHGILTRHETITTARR